MSATNPPKLAVIVPCFNEDEVFPEAAKRLSHKVQSLVDRGAISRNSATYFVDDGSTDITWTLIKEEAATNPRVHGIKLATNYGQQHALLAGLTSAPGDIFITIDVDLQDDIEAMDTMIAKYQEGFDIIFGARSSRKSDSKFKRNTALGFYKLLGFIGVRLVFNHAEYRLMSRRAVEALQGYREVNIFLRGIIANMGFRTATIYYDRGERHAGIGKYPVWRMLGLGWDAITSFSNFPLRAITAMGLFTSFLSLVALTWVLSVRFFSEDAVPGWASITLPLLFLGGVQLLSLGIIGEYLAKIYLETKARPRFHIEEKI